MKSRKTKLAVFMICVMCLVPFCASAYVGGLHHASHYWGSSVQSLAYINGNVMRHDNSFITNILTFQPKRGLILGEMYTHWDRDTSGRSPRSYYQIEFYEGRWNNNDQLVPPGSTKRVNLVSWSGTESNEQGDQRLDITGRLDNGSDITMTVRMVNLENGVEGEPIPQSTTLKTLPEETHGYTWAIQVDFTSTPIPSTSPYQADRPIYMKLSMYSFGNASHSNKNRTIMLGDTLPVTYETGEFQLDNRSVSEIYTDSYAYNNQFIALGRYNSADCVVGQNTLHCFDGYYNVGGYESVTNQPFGHFLEVRNNENTAAIGQQLGEDAAVCVTVCDSGHLLFGMRNVYNQDIWEGLSANEQADPAVFTPQGNTLGVLYNTARNSYTLTEGTSRAALKATHGSSLIATFSGVCAKSGDGYTFSGGSCLVGKNIGLTWNPLEGAAKVTVKQTSASTVSVTIDDGVKVATPNFVLFKKRTGTTGGLTVSFDSGVMHLNMDETKNSAVVNLDIPGSTGRLKSVYEDEEDSIVCTGTLGLQTLPLRLYNLSISKLRLAFDKDYVGGSGQPIYTTTGIKAEGSVGLGDVVGISIVNATADIDTFAAEPYYKFKVGMNAFIASFDGELELMRIFNGQLIPNKLAFHFKNDVVSIPLVPPVVVARLYGVSGGFDKLATTVNMIQSGDFYGLPPLRLSAGGDVKALGIIEGSASMTIGAAYISKTLSGAEILDLKVLEKYVETMGLTAGRRTFRNKVFKGNTVEMSWDFLIAAPSDWEVIKAGANFSWNSFAGVTDTTETKKDLYLMLSIAAGLRGSLHVPKNVGLIGGMELFSTSFALDLNVETMAENVSGISSMADVGEKISELVRNASLKGSVSKSGKLLFIPYRVAYIFETKKVDFDLFSKAKVNIFASDRDSTLFLSDNRVLASSNAETQATVAKKPVMMASATNGTLTKIAPGATVTPNGTDGKSYSVTLGPGSPQKDQVLFVLTPRALGNVSGAFQAGLTVTDNGGHPLTLHPYPIDTYDPAVNPDANALVSASDGTEKPRGTYTICAGSIADAAFNYQSITLTATEAFDVTVLQAVPAATLASGVLNGNQTVSLTIADYNSAKSYVARLYLGTEAGGKQFYLNETTVTGAAMQLPVPLNGTIVPSGTYHVTVSLVEKLDVTLSGQTENVAISCGDAACGTAQYTNTDAPQAAREVTLAATGSAVLQASWKAPATGIAPDGYIVTLYRKDAAGQWVNSTASYDVSKQADGSWKGATLTGDVFALDMAPTISGDGSEAGTVNPDANSARLQTGKDYRASVTPYVLQTSALQADPGQLKGPEAHSDAAGTLLPTPTYPSIAYNPSPVRNGENVRILSVGSADQLLSIATNMLCDVTVTELSTGTLLASGSGVSTANPLQMTLPYDTFSGTTTLKVVASNTHNGLSDKTSDFISLHKDEDPPIVILDRSTVRLANASFTVSGTTDPYARLHLDSDASLMNTTLGIGATADSNGRFSISVPASGIDFETPKMCYINASDSAQNSTRAPFIVTASATAIAPTIITSSLPDGAVSTPYEQAIASSGFTPIRYAIVSGTLPHGLSLNADTGRISGTPTQAGQYQFSVKATNAYGSDTRAFSLAILAATVKPPATDDSAPLFLLMTLCCVSALGLAMLMSCKRRKA